MEGACELTGAGAAGQINGVAVPRKLGIRLCILLQDRSAK